MADQYISGISINGGQLNAHEIVVGPGASIVHLNTHPTAVDATDTDTADTGPAPSPTRAAPSVDQPDNPDVDFLVSYVDADRAWAEWIAWHLEDVGYQTRIRAWDLLPGGAYVHEIHQAVQQAARTVVVLSTAYLHSAAIQAQWQAAWFRDPDGRQRRLLLARVEDCDRPGLLAQMIGIDLYGVDADIARDRLHHAATAQRAKPSRPPTFPTPPRAPRPPLPPAAAPRDRRGLPHPAGGDGHEGRLRGRTHEAWGRSAGMTAQSVIDACRVNR